MNENHGWTSIRDLKVTTMERHTSVDGKRVGWRASVLSDNGKSWHFSLLDGETEWVCDGAFTATICPIWFNGFGSRCTRMQVAISGLQDLLELARHAATIAL